MLIEITKDVFKSLAKDIPASLVSLPVESSHLSCMQYAQDGIIILQAEYWKQPNDKCRVVYKADTSKVGRCTSCNLIFPNDMLFGDGENRDNDQCEHCMTYPEY